MLGEGFYRLSCYIQNNDYRLFYSKILGMISLFIMDPVGFAMKNLRIAKLMGIKNENIATIFVSNPQGFMATLRVTW